MRTFSKILACLCVLASVASAQVASPTVIYAPDVAHRIRTVGPLVLTGGGLVGCDRTTNPGFVTCTFGGGSGTMTSISNSDGTLALTPNPITTTGTLALALGHANAWSGQQTFNAAVTAFAANANLQAASAATNTTGLTITSNVADGASSTGIILQNTASLSTAGSRLLRIQNSPGTDETTIDAVGNIYLPHATLGITVPNGSAVGIYNASGFKGLAVDFSTFAAAVYGGDFTPYVNEGYSSGNVSHRWLTVWGDWTDTKQGAQLTAAGTITPTSGLHHVTGATPITTIATTNLPTSGNVRLTIVADSATITWSTGGNIGASGTVTQGKAQDFVYDSSATTWYPVQ